jgi:hypothetical protein
LSARQALHGDFAAIVALVQHFTKIYQPDLILIYINFGGPSHCSRPEYVSKYIFLLILIDKAFQVLYLYGVI